MTWPVVVAVRYQIAKHGYKSASAAGRTFNVVVAKGSCTVGAKSLTYRVSSPEASTGLEESVLASDDLHDRAEKCRALAETFRDADLRLKMLRTADLFDELAVQVELSATKQLLRARWPRA